MKYRIWASKQDRLELTAHFNTSMTTVSESLSFKRKQQFHSEIRNYAVNYLQGQLIDLNYGQTG
jgi:hypothetical protein